MVLLMEDRSIVFPAVPSRSHWSLGSGVLAVGIARRGWADLRLPVFIDTVGGQWSRFERPSLLRHIYDL